MRKKSKLEFSVIISLAFSSAFLILVLVDFHFPYTNPNFYEAAVIFFEDFDPLARFRGGQPTDPTNFINNLIK